MDNTLIVKSGTTSIKYLVVDKIPYIVLTVFGITIIKLNIKNFVVDIVDFLINKVFGSYENYYAEREKNEETRPV